MLASEAVVSIFFVALTWGITNPLMRLGTSRPKPKSSSNLVTRLFQEVFYLIQNWRFSLPFVINQCGSVLYMRTLGICELTIIVPLVNSLTFLFTSITGFLLGEKFNVGVIIGSCFIMLGVSICVLSKIGNVP